MSQYAESMFEQKSNDETEFERSPSLSSEASASTILIAKRQAILEHIAERKESGGQAKLNWRELLKEAEVTLDEARLKLAIFVLQKEGVKAQHREATRASLFLKWFAAEDASVREMTSARSSEMASVYKAVRILTPEVINPLPEPDDKIDPLALDQLVIRFRESQLTMDKSARSDLLHSPSSKIRTTTKLLFPATNDSSALDWREYALCAQTDPEIFFPEGNGNTREAKKICNNCDVRDQCLNYALENDERFGVWGGKSEHERRYLRRRRYFAI